ncbi:MAG: thioredoxin family protein [Acidimicrobiia bacterium]
MVAVTSSMLALGTRAPDFSLPDTVTGDTVSLADFAAMRAVLVMFICNHCPYVKHVRQGLADLGHDYEASDIGIIAISSNDVGDFPEDGPVEMAREAEEAGYRFPYLYDESQRVARAYGAMCTPDFFLFDADRTLAYRGRLDGSRPNTEVPVTGGELRAAIDAVLAGEPVPGEQHPSMGCSIKWKPGNVPAYFTAAS